MLISYCCILVAILLPYAWTIVAKTKGQGYDNRAPRAWLAAQQSPSVHRANAAQLNAFEALPAFVAAVLMAQLTHVSATRITCFSLIFIAARIGHGLFYIADHARGRSLAWAIGFLAVLGLIVQALIKIGV